MKKIYNKPVSLTDVNEAKCLYFYRFTEVQYQNWLKSDQEAKLEPAGKDYNLKDYLASINSEDEEEE